MKKSICYLIIFLMLFACVFFVPGCSCPYVLNCNFCYNAACNCSEKILIGDRDPSIPSYIKKTDDGFQYFFKNINEACIVKLPESEEVTIPVYFKERLVTQLGGRYQGIASSKEYYLDFSGVKKVNVLHKFVADYIRNYKDIETLVYVDYVYGRFINNTDGYIQGLRPAYLIDYKGIEDVVKTKIWLVNGENQGKNSDYTVDVIYLSQSVTVIEKGVFDGLQGTVIKTSYESKPDGWEDGWNGDCEVQWGEKF